MSSGNDQDFDPDATRRGQRAERAADRVAGDAAAECDGGAGAERDPARPASRPGVRRRRTRPTSVARWATTCASWSSPATPAPALLQQFDHAQPEFIAVHDVGTGSSRKLLAGVAQASGLRMKQARHPPPGLRQHAGHAGVPRVRRRRRAATLRVYSTDVEADAQTRLGLARVLLAYSRLGVLMVGDLPAQALASAFKPLRDAIVTGPWPNRDLLLLPLASSAALASQGSDLGRGTGVTVRTTPAVLRPADAWTFISGAWNRLRTQMAATGKLVPELATPVARPAPSAQPDRAADLRWQRRQAGGDSGAGAGVAATDARCAAGAGGRPSEPVTSALMAHYVEQLCKLNGMLDCCVFEAASGRSIAHAGSARATSSGLAAAGASLLAAITRAGHRLGLEAGWPEAAITLATRHLVLRPCRRHPHLMLHAVLDKSSANLTLARLQIQRMDELFDSASA